MSIDSDSEQRLQLTDEVQTDLAASSGRLSNHNGRFALFDTALGKKRLVGLLLFAAILIIFLSFNRFPKLDIVGGDLEAVTSPDVQCFQGFCIDRDPGSTFLSRWWVFSITYLQLVSVGMTFAFLIAGLAESFLIPLGTGKSFLSGGLFKRTVKGLAVGPVMNLCSACIVPVSSAFQKRGGGVAGAIAMVQGSATMNVPALAMAFFVFTPLLGFSRLILALVGALLIGPIVVMAIRRGGKPLDEGPEPPPELPMSDVYSSWRPVLVEAFRDWARVTIGYVVRMGPIMVIAGFASGLAIQWITPSSVSDYLGNDFLGVAIAATIGILINVPLLFEIPLVALLLLLGMGTAPAATLLFAAAAGGPITFWGLARIMPRRGIVTFAMATWAVGVLGGLGILVIGTFIWNENSSLKIAPVQAADAPFFLDMTVTTNLEFQHNEFGDEVMPMGGGVVVFDFNGDDLHDIFVANSRGSNALYRNLGDGTFSEEAAIAGVNDVDGRGNGGCSSDFDNDGDQDLYLTNYGQSRLFLNDGDSTFTDATIIAGLKDSNPFFRSTGCAWGDYDQDGYLDLIVVRHLHEWDKNIFHTKDYFSAVGGLALYRNNADGTFTNLTSLLKDPTHEVVIPLRGEGQVMGNIWGAGYQPGWLDFDNDGDLDLYVVNDFGAEIQPNVLWRNDGKGPKGVWKFVDISETSGADARIYGMALAISDYDSNGYLDLFMTNIGDTVLLRNNGDGATFTNTMMHDAPDISTIGLKVRVTWGAVFMDFDNDGDEDLYVSSGYLAGQAAGNAEEQANILLRNMGDSTFIDISPGSGVNDSGVGRGVSYLDFDLDGCLDLYIVNLGQTARFFRNICDYGNSWLIIKTVGTTSNRDGIGARITLLSDGATQIREISSGGSQMGQNMMEAHFGLGPSVMQVDSVTINWPSGVVQTLTEVDVNQRLVITEPR